MTLKEVLLDKISQLNVHRSPFIWGRAFSIFPNEVYSRLCSEAPRGHTTIVSSGRRRDKQYQFGVLPIIKQSACLTGMNVISPLWQEAVLALMDRDLVLAVADRLELRFDQYSADIEYFHSTGVTVIGPHTDKSDQYYVLIFYLTGADQLNMGGELRLLGSCDPTDIRVSLPPVDNSAVIIKRDDNSWHSVGSIKSRSHDWRQTLLLKVRRV